jgi:hypothetical protein
MNYSANQKVPHLVQNPQHSLLCSQMTTNRKLRPFGEVNHPPAIPKEFV